MEASARRRNWARTNLIRKNKTSNPRRPLKKGDPPAFIGKHVCKGFSKGGKKKGPSIKCGHFISENGSHRERVLNEQ